jgi:hypothetical protein
VLGKQAAKGIEELRALPHEKIARMELSRTCLLLFALHRHEAHGRPLRCLADRLCIRGIVLLPLHERLPVSRRDKPYLMTEALQLAAQ